MENFSGCTVALGFFDGVHLAHRKLIETAKNKAEKSGSPLAVFTFPCESAGLKRGAPRLYGTETKVSLLYEAGADIVVIADFASVANQSPEEFIDRILIKTLGAKSAVCGFNFRFGKNAAGNAEFLAKNLTEKGCECIIFPEYKLGDIPLSSTYIRSLLSEGLASEASKALGKPYFIEGIISHGDGRGRKMGIPTVNIPLPRDELLKRGVYAAAAVIDGVAYPAITNAGICPTFKEREAHTETYIFDFSEEVYEKRAKVYFLEFLRDEVRFEDIKELKMQIEVDKNKAKDIFSKIKWQELGLN